MFESFENITSLHCHVEKYEKNNLLKLHINRKEYLQTKRKTLSLFEIIFNVLQHQFDHLCYVPTLKNCCAVFVL